MNFINFEIKARLENPETASKVLGKIGAFFIGEEDQVDTYFNVANGRMKLREGKNYSFLIYYERENKKEPKQSRIRMLSVDIDSSLRDILEESLGVLAVVKKKREIYCLNNVKFHIDEVSGLGSFFEIEAVDSKLDIGSEKLLEQCKSYVDVFGILEEDLISESYLDLILRK